MGRLSDVGKNIANRLVSISGSDWTYSRGTKSETIAMYKSDNPPLLEHSDNGLAIELTIYSFRCETSLLSSFSVPTQGDRITDGTTIYEVQPVVDKCFYTVGGMTHIHAVLKKSA